MRAFSSNPRRQRGKRRSEACPGRSIASSTPSPCPPPPQCSHSTSNCTRVTLSTQVLHTGIAPGSFFRAFLSGAQGFEYGKMNFSRPDVALCACDPPPLLVVLDFITKRSQSRCDRSPFALLHFLVPGLGLGNMILSLPWSNQD